MTLAVALFSMYGSIAALSASVFFMMAGRKEEAIWCVLLAINLKLPFQGPTEKNRDGGRPESRD